VMTGELKRKRRRCEVIRARVDIGRDREAGTQPWQREPLFMPLTGSSS
jgi:hypothetical protein